MCHTLASEILFRLLGVTGPLVGRTPAGGEAGDSKNQIDQTIFMNSRLRGAWALRVPHFGHRNPISSDERHRPVAWPDAGRGRGLGSKRPKLPDDVSQFSSGRCVGMACATPWPSKFHFERFASPTRCSDRRRRGSRLGIKTTKLTRRCFSILVW